MAISTIQPSLLWLVNQVSSLLSLHHSPPFIRQWNSICKEMIGWPHSNNLLGWYIMVCKEIHIPFTCWNSNQRFISEIHIPSQVHWGSAYLFLQIFVGPSRHAAEKEASSMRWRRKSRRTVPARQGAPLENLCEKQHWGKQKMMTNDG
jgi:hypothetical protein